MNFIVCELNENTTTEISSAVQKEDNREDIK